MRALGPLFTEAAAFETAARSAEQAITNELAYFQSGAEVRALRSAIATRNRAAIVNAAAPVLAHLAQTQRALRALDGLFNDADALISRIEAAPNTLLGTAAARGAAEIERTVRFPIASASRGDVTVRLSGAVSAALIAPLDAPPELPSVPGMAPLRSLMTTVTFMAQASMAGLDDLRALINDAQALADDANTLVGEARRAPLRYQDEAEATRAQNTIAELSARGNALSERASTVAAGLRGHIEVGAHVVQATAPGAGLRAAGLRLEGTIGEHVDFSGSVTLRNLIGFIPGETTDYALVQAEDGSFMLGQLGPRARANVFHHFYPAGAAVDASLRVHNDSASLELRAGLVTRLQAFYLATSVVVPDVRAPAVLPPQFLLGLGVETEHFSLILSAGADAALLTGDPTAARSAHGSLSLSVHF
jgi:hypothetical protein